MSEISAMSADIENSYMTIGECTTGNEKLR